MKKILFIIGMIVLFLGSFYIGNKIYKRYEENRSIEQYIQIEEVVSEEEKIKPNAILTSKIIYTKCAHTKTKQEEISSDLVNITREEFQEKYNEWKIEKFSPEEIVIIKNTNGYCGEHYILRNNNGYVTVYTIDELNKQEIYLTTDIAVIYLPETDQINLEHGMYIYGKEKLIELLQDFE